LAGFLENCVNKPVDTTGSLAVIGGVIGTLTIVKALSLLQFKALSIVLLLQKLQPIFVILLAIVILKEKTGKNFALWATIGVIASYFLTFGFNLPNVNADKNTIIAALLAVLAAFSFAVGTVFGKKIATKLDFVTVTYYRYGITSLLMFFYLIFNYPKLLLILNLSSKIWMIFWIIPLTTGIGAMFLYFYGLKNVNATVSTICELFFPISALFLDYLVNGIILSPIQIISAAVMIFAVTMLIFQHQNYKKTKAKANAR